MGKKFYAVKIGRKPGVYETWLECQEQINGYSGSVYKSFVTKEDALEFIKSNEEKTIESSEVQAVAYVDGSYNLTDNAFSYGMVIFYNGEELHFSRKYHDDDLAEMHNVAGEIKGAEAAMQFCLDHDIPNIKIYYDYEGIKKWCDGSWEAKKSGTIAYVNFYKYVSTKVHVVFEKVKGHSGNTYNDLADRLAKKAFGIEDLDPMYTENKQMVKKKIFIDRNVIVSSVREIAKQQWREVKVNELKKVGNAQRCEIMADGRLAKIDFYFNKDGTTTINPTGENIDISSVIKTIMEEQCKYTNIVHAKTYSLKKLPKEWADKLIAYLSSLEDVACEESNIDAVPTHKMHVFSSKIGDKLTINVYENGTLTLQGKPAYLYSEAISFLSYCQDVSVDDIIGSINSLHNINVKINDVRNDMEALMPRAYSNIDDTILKLLSPSISLRKVNIPLEDYSCYTFPALRALEGYIKYLFDLKGIVIKQTFGNIFNGDVLTASTISTIGDPVFQEELEKLYKYLKNNRHVIFHTNQILIGTKMISDKHEADEIINSVIHLIESSYVKIFCR